MAKAKTVFICQACGYESAKWMGRCTACGEWNMMVEEVKREEGAPGNLGALSHPKPLPLKEIEVDKEVRLHTGSGELDRVLGGGLVRGSLVLVGGDPGIGKSTLLLQVCRHLGKAGTVLYASGEESQQQIKLRADRLGVDTESLLLMSETDLDVIIQAVEDTKPAVLIVDSVQTVYKSDLSSAPGSVSQVREVTMELMRRAKGTDMAVLLVGHVTKDGALAGPRVLEHMVDCVLYFEGERHQSYRVLRAVKNRFGSTNEIGVFEMQDKGLAEVGNPSKMLLSGRPKEAPGSAVICAMEGTRPVLAEVQALVTPSVFGNPRRMATGVDYNRVQMLMAVLEKRVGLNLGNQDAHVNVVGGLKIDDPAADLGIMAAIASSYREFVIPTDVMLIGEVGLTGEVRAAGNVKKRVQESAKMGFRTMILSEGSAKQAGDIPGVTVIGVRHVKDALAQLQK